MLYSGTRRQGAKPRGEGQEVEDPWIQTVDRRRDKMPSVLNMRCPENDGRESRPEEGRLPSRAPFRSRCTTTGLNDSHKWALSRNS